MLSIGRVGPANAGYYQSAVVAGAEDYYAGDGDAPGVWVGRAGLVGAVAGSLATAVDAKLLLEAKCAPDGTRLGKTTVSERSVTAFDLTFSVPKSVSVLYALGDERVAAEIEAAHAVAVEEAIKSMSPRIAFTRTGRAGAAVVDAEEVFGIRYRHRTSRALDPQLHDHVLIANAVRTVSDGEWRTLDARGLFREAKAAGTVFQTHLRAETQRRLGVRFNEVDGNGQADIVGIDETLLVEFSARSHDIEAALAEWTTRFVEREGRSPSRAEVGKAHKTIVLATRPGKPDEAGLSTVTLRQAWRRRADTIVDVDRMLAETLGNPPSPAVIVRPDIEVVLAAVELKHAEWSESQLIEQIAMRVDGPDPATIAATINAVSDDAMASAGVVDLTPPADAGDMVRASDGRPVHLPPSAVRYTTSRHLLREGDVIEWAQAPVAEGHRAVSFEAQSVAGLDDSQIAAVSEMLTNPRPVMTVVGPAGSGKTRMLGAAVASWTEHGISVFGAAPSAAAASELREGAGVPSDTLHKLVYEHSTQQHNGQNRPGAPWDLPAGSVVVIDEAGMVDTRLLHEYSQIAQARNWRTVLVGDHRQLGSVDAGGLFAELVADPDVTTVELDTLHRFEHDWEAAASLALRDGDSRAVDTYDRHGCIHGHTDQIAAVDAVADEAIDAIVTGRDVLVMAATNRVVEELNTTVTERLLVARWLDPDELIEIGGHVFFPDQPVVTRANDRTLTYGPDGVEWVRNGDRWTVDAGTRDDLYLTNLDNGHRHAIPGDYIAAGNVTVGYASTINRAQGATVDEAHLVIDDRTSAAQLYVGITRGRHANHVHTAPPSFDPERHGPREAGTDWSPSGAVGAAVDRQSDQMSATSRRLTLRTLAAESRNEEPDRAVYEPASEVGPTQAVPERVAAARRRLEQLARRKPTRGLER